MADEILDDEDNNLITNTTCIGISMKYTYLIY